MSNPRTVITLFSILVITAVIGQFSIVQAPPTINYALTQSTSRTLETNSPGITLTLNVSNANTGVLYGFLWNVTDPSGGVTQFLDGGSPTSSGVLTLMSVYPRDFSSASVKYNGTYTTVVSQFRPGPGGLVATSKFYAGLTDAISYERTAKVLISAQGYSSKENVTVTLSHGGALAPGFPTFNLTSGNGVLWYEWPIPASLALGNYNVTLSGQFTTKRPSDSQIFAVVPTSVIISQIGVNATIPQALGTAIFSFTASYPDGTLAKTGISTIRLIEPDGTTTQMIIASYNTTLNAFEGAYRVSSSSPSGAWTAIIDPNTFNDGYGNLGPSAVVVRSFVVQPDTVQSMTETYLLLTAVIFLGAALTIIVSWILFFGRKKVQRNVLKVDFQTIEREASRVQNRDFFVKVQDQLKQQQEKKPKEEIEDS